MCIMYQSKCGSWILHLLSFSSFLCPLSPLFILSFPSPFPLFFLSQFFLPLSLLVYIIYHSLGRKTTGCKGGTCSNLSPDKTFVRSIVNHFLKTSNTRDNENVQLHKSVNESHLETLIRAPSSPVIALESRRVARGGMCGLSGPPHLFLF